MDFDACEREIDGEPRPCYGRSILPLDEPPRFCTCPAGQAALVRFEEGLAIKWPGAEVPAGLTGVRLHGTKRFHAKHPDRADAIDAAERFVDAYRSGRRPGAGIAFFGPVGTGKTGVLAAIKHELNALGVPCLWYDYAGLVQAVQAQYGSSDMRDTRITNAQRCEVLFIDDLGDPFRDRGETQETEDKRRIMQAVIGERVARRRPTIVSANYNSLGALSDQFDLRIADRIREMCECHAMPGDSMRRAPRI